MRLFLAIEIDETVRTRAAEIVASVRSSVDTVLSVRWVPPENLHLTLWFLGEVSEAGAAPLRAAIERPFETAAFGLRIGAPGAFPRSGTPRVLWLGVEEGSASMAALHTELAMRLEPLGIEPERRPFSAHLTVGRVKGVRAGAARLSRCVWEEAPNASSGCRVSAVTLFQSRLSPKGAAYEPLVRVPLKAHP